MDYPHHVGLPGWLGYSSTPVLHKSKAVITALANSLSKRTVTPRSKHSAWLPNLSDLEFFSKLAMSALPSLRSKFELHSLLIMIKNLPRNNLMASARKSTASINCSYPAIAGHDDQDTALLPRVKCT